MSVEELLVYLITPAAQIAIIVALAEVAKRLGLKDKFVPLLDLGLGLISGIVVFGIAQSHDIVASVILGIAIGLSACGLYSGVKNVCEGAGK